MEYGLDIGPGAIRVAADAPDGVTIESVPPIVTAVDDEAHEPSEPGLFVERDGTNYAVGSTARSVADAGDGSPESLFSNGVLTVDGYAEPALEALVDDALETIEPNGERLCYTTPGSLVDAAEPTAAHRDTVESVLADRGLEATPISRGFAVVYDQLSGDNYTGLGIYVDDQTTAVALAYYGVPAMAFSLAKGSEWVVERAAAETGHDPAQVAGVLEEFTLDPDATGGIESALAQAHDDLIGEIVDAIETEADENDVQQGLAVPIAIAGPGAIEGLEYLLGGRFDAAPLPFSVRGVRLADDPAASAARGALAAAEDDVDVYEDVTWSDGADDSVETEADRPESAEQTTLTFEEADDGIAADPDRSDDAIEQLFDRLGDRDEEIQTIRADLESALEELEYVEERTAAADAVADLEGRLEEVADDLASLETESATHASEEALADLATDFESLSAAVSDVTGDVESLESKLQNDLERIETSLESLEETTADERERLEARIGDLAADFEGVSGRTATLEDRLEDLRTTLETVEEETASVEDLETLEGETASVEDLESVTETASRLGERLETVDEGLEDVRDRVDEDLDGVESQVDEVADRLEEYTDRADDERESVESAVETIETELEATADGVERIDDDLEDVHRTLRDRAEDIERLEEEFEDLESATATVDGLESLRETVADLESRAASTESVDDLADDLEGVENQVGEVETTLADRIESLDTDLEGAVSDLREAIEAGPDAELEDRLEAVADRVGNLAEATDRLDDLSDRVDDVAEETNRVDDLSDRVDDVTEQTDRVDDLSDRVDDVAEKTDRLDDLSDRVDDVDDRAERLEDRTRENATHLEEQDDRLERTDDRLEDQADRLESVTESIDDLAAANEDDEATASRLSDIEERLTAIESRETAATERAEDLEEVRTELTELRERTTDQDQETTGDGPGLVTSVVAGGGAAGLVAGGYHLLVDGGFVSESLVADGTVGAVVVAIGFVLVLVAVALGR